MEYSLNAGEWNKVFAVPSSVVDKYIKLASGNSLKLLLYLIRHGGEYLTAEILRAELGFEELGELEDAALFWVQRGIICAKNSKDAMTMTAASEQVGAPLPVQAMTSENKTVIRQAKPAIISNGSIAQSINNSPEMKMLFDEAEKMFNRPLKNNERQTIIQLSEHYGLPCDVSLMLLGYCFKINKATPAYISKVAEDWANDEIMTVQLADEKIINLEKQNDVEHRICEASGISSGISAGNRAFIKTWVVDWGFGEDMIMLAYEKTVNGAGKWSFPYANKILENWKLKGARTPREAEKLDEEFKKSKSFKRSSATKQHISDDEDKISSLDLDMVMNQVMNNYKK